jgi:hypothetical protein
MSKAKRLKEIRSLRAKLLKDMPTVFKDTSIKHKAKFAGFDPQTAKPLYIIPYTKISGKRQATKAARRAHAKGERA